MDDGLGSAQNAAWFFLPFLPWTAWSMNAETRPCGADAADPSPSSSVAWSAGEVPSAADPGHGQPASEPPSREAGAVRAERWSLQAYGARAFTGAPVRAAVTPDVGPLAITRQNIRLDRIEAKHSGGSRTACLAIRLCVGRPLIIPMIIQTILL